MLLQVARCGRPTSSLAPLFSSLLMAHLTPWRERRERGRGRSRMYGKKSGQLANRGSGFPRLSVSTVPCSRGRVSLPWPALVSQLESEGLALTGVSGPWPSDRAAFSSPAISAAGPGLSVPHLLASCCCPPALPSFILLLFGECQQLCEVLPEGRYSHHGLAAGRKFLSALPP